MNMEKKLVLAAGLTLLGGATAFGEYARGYFNNWANDCPLTGTIGQYEVFGTTEPEDIDYVAGNAWHCPKNTEPYASASMRMPLKVALGDRPFVRLGVNPTTGDDAPTKVELKYKAGTNRWATLTMGPESPGDGWQTKYDGNAYYTNSIPTDKFTVGMNVQYYFYVEYANSSLFGESSVGTTDQRGSIAYLGPNEARSHPFEFTVEAAPPVGFNDPQGTPIEDPAVIEWLTDNGFTQADIDALGDDAAATDKLYECFLLNCSITAANPGGALSITGFAVSNDQISVTVQLVRQSPLGFITGALYLYGADDLAEGFYVDPIANELIDFGDGDSTFDVDSATVSTGGPVTQTVTATFDTYYVWETFFKAAIEPQHAEEPWEDPGEEPDPDPEGWEE